MKLAVIPAAILASGLVIGQASYSAFSATTVNPTNNWTAGSVALADNDSNTAIFTEMNLKPGSTNTRCIIVTSSGSLASTVKLYGTAPTTTNALSSSINLVVTQGNGTTGTFGSCTGFTPNATTPGVYSGTLLNFGSTSTGYASGVGNWAPTGGTTAETRTYQFQYTVDSAAPNTTQNGTASIGFTWEAQNS